MVRCKFTATQNENGSIVMEPVVGGSPENDAFYAATPGGRLTFSTVNEKAAAEIEVGKEYYIDISPAT